MKLDDDGPGEFGAALKNIFDAWDEQHGPFGRGDEAVHTFEVSIDGPDDFERVEFSAEQQRLRVAGLIDSDMASEAELAVGRKGVYRGCDVWSDRINETIAVGHNT